MSPSGTYYLVVAILILIMGGVLIVGFFVHLYRNRKNKRTIKRTLFGALLLIALAIVPYKLINYWLPSYAHNHFGETVDVPLDVESIDSLDYQSHFDFVQNYKDWMEDQLYHLQKSRSSFVSHSKSRKIQAAYLGYQNSPDSSIRDVGLLFYTLHMSNLRVDADKNQLRLDSISNKEIPCFSYVQGVTDFAKNSWADKDSAEANLIRSIKKRECLTESTAELARLYWYFSEEDKLFDLVYSEEHEEMVPISFKRHVYFMDFNWAGYWKMWFKYEVHHWGLLNALAAALLLLLWVFFLKKLDIYEPEKWKYVIITFILSVICMQLIKPMHDFQWSILHYYRPNNPTSDLAYISISVGMVEELVKILPVLIMLKFSKAINEPFDYIFYPAIAALGFAFVENVHYYDESMFNVSIRAFYCYVGHMVWSATIGYGLMLAKYRGYNSILMFIGFFLIASFMHGFYDFWLMDWWAMEYSWVSDIILIISIHLLIYYSNNTLNISNFYNPKIKLDRELIKFMGVAICISILMTGFVFISIMFGTTVGNDYLLTSTASMSFPMFFFVLSLGGMREMRGWLRPITVPLRGLFPEKKAYKDLSGLSLSLSIHKAHDINKELVPDKLKLSQNVVLKRRIVIDDNLDAYIAELERPIEIQNVFTNQVIIIPHWDNMKFDRKGKVLARLYYFESDDIIYAPLVQEKDLTYLGRLFSKTI